MIKSFVRLLFGKPEPELLMEAPTDKWTIEPYDPERDAPPEDHHAQPDEDPPDIEDGRA